MPELKKESTTKSIFHLLYHKRIFAKCPKCDKYLALFEIYNENCGECGRIKFNKIILVDFVKEKPDFEEIYL